MPFASSICFTAADSAGPATAIGPGSAAYTSTEILARVPALRQKSSTSIAAS
jgi:hypothetical protein